MILVAHDRWFLEAVTTSVLELTPARAHYFAGPWHEWRREKAARAAAAEKTADRVAVDIERLERFVARFRYKKSKAKQAQAKLTQIGRLEQERSQATEELVALTRKRRTLGFDFLRPPRTGRVVLEAEGIGLTAGDKRCSRTPRSSSSAARRSASSARTGAGRRRSCWRCSAAIRSTRGTPGSGTASSPGTSPSTRIELPSQGSVLDCAAAATGLPRPQAQMLLGRFLFSGWETHERAVTALSGGERRRLALALLVASGANFLVLDEPTNHLDLESREALESALEAFPGPFSSSRTTVPCSTRCPTGSSRSRSALCARTTVAGRTSSASGARASRSPRRPGDHAAPRCSAPPARQPSELELLEATIASTEARVAELEGKLATDWTNMDVLAAHRAARDELTELLGRWEVLFEEPDAR